MEELVWVILEYLYGILGFSSMLLGILILFCHLKVQNLRKVPGQLMCMQTSYLILTDFLWFFNALTLRTE